MADEIEIIKLVLDARDAIQELMDLDTKTQEYSVVVEKLGGLLTKLSLISKDALKSVATDFETLELSAEQYSKALAGVALAGEKANLATRIPLNNVNMKQAIGENAGFDVSQFVGAQGLTPELNAVTTAMKNIQATNPSVTFREIGDSMKSAGINANTVKQGVEQLEPATAGAARGFNVLRTAMGFLTAMAISAIIQSIIQLFKSIIDGANQAEQAVINLGIAEKTLSQSGVDITPTQLADVVDKVTKAYDTVSKIDASKMVGNLATLTEELGLSADEYEKLAMAIPLLAERSGKTIEEATQIITNGLSKSGRGFTALLEPMNATIIKEKVISMGLVENADAYKALTAEQKLSLDVQAEIQMLSEKTKNDTEAQTKYDNSPAGAQKAVNAAWEDFAATLGKFAAPTIIEFLQELTKELKEVNTWLDNNSKAIDEWSAQFAGVAAVFAEIKKNGGGIQGILSASIQGILTGGSLDKVYNDAVSKAKQIQKDSMQMGADNPTAPKEKSVEANTDLKDALDKMNKELLDAQIEFAQKMKDIEIDLGRKMEDIDIEYARKRADIADEYNKQVQDINTTSNDKIAGIKAKQAQDNQKARDDELKRELDFQNKMQEMKEKFLMDLEDALHARDARQILKLIRQYDLNKLQAERQYALDSANAARDEKLRKENQAAELKDAEDERKKKLKIAQQDYADKVAKLAADELAETKAAVLAANRKIQDLEKSNADRLAVVAANLRNEYNLTQDGLQKIVDLYGQYYSDVSQIYAAMQSMMGGMSGGGSKPVAGAWQAPTNKGINTHKSINGSGAAEGGTFLANKPTTMTFGEAGPEMATFVPLGRTGKDVNSTFSSMGGGQGVGGTIQIEMLLSPDLESRIVNNTLNKTADVIFRTSKSKG